jgi:hypothetical protein
MVRLLPKDLPVERLGLLAAPRLMELQRLLHIRIERAGRATRPAAGVCRSSVIFANGKPAVFVGPPDLSHTGKRFKTNACRPEARSGYGTTTCIKAKT